MKLYRWLALLVWVPLVGVIAAEPETTVRTPGEILGNKVYLRGQPSFKGEVIARLNTGDKVVILDEIEVKNPKPKEPAKWYKVELAPHASAWVHSLFLDADSKTVKPNRLNLRAGPGENYSILGRVNKGTALKSLGQREDWIEVEAPAEGYAFVAADLVKPGEAPSLPETTEKKPEPEKNEVPPPLPEQKAETVVDLPAPKPAAALQTPPVVPAPPKDEPPARRVVTREGFITRTSSPHAPSDFDLVDVRNRYVLNYLHVTDTNVVLKKFKGKRVVVTGEEYMDSRWRTPVLSIETLDVME